MPRVLSQTFGVVGAILEKDGKILLVKEAQMGKPDHGKWSHPAGWIEVGEDPIEAIKREVKEEAGFQFVPTHILGLYSLVREDLRAKINGVPHPIKIIFVGEASKEKKADLADDISGIKWFSPEEIYRMDQDTLRDLDIKNMVRDFFSNKRYPLGLLTHTISKE